MRILLLFCVSWITCGSIAAQSYAGFGASVGGFLRSGDWADTYGNSMSAGGRFEKGFANGFVVSAVGDIFFGEAVFVDVLAPLRTSEGAVLGDLGAQAARASTSLKSRGQRYAVLAGYQRSLGDLGWGIRGSAGPSYMIHNIRIQTDASLNASNLRDEYKKGYDRRAGGLGGYAEAGVQYLMADGGFRAFLLATVSVSRTESLRSTQFDLLTPAPTAGTDTALGLRLGVVLGLWRNTSGREAEDIYY